MEWREIGPYRGAVIWVRELRAGCWVAAVTPVPALVEKRPATAPPSGGMILPAGFASRSAAVEAARRYVDREQERRLHGTGSPSEDAGARPPDPRPWTRQFARFPVSLPVLVRAGQAPGREIPGRARDVGAGGLMAELPVNMGAGSAVGLLLQTRSGRRELEARVVWTAATEGTVRHGCAFPVPQSPDFAVELFIEGMG